MNTTFFIALIIYLAVFITIGILDLKKISNFTDYSVAGKKQGGFSVIMTLLATVIGASTTIGITDTVYKIGFPGIWWLAFGALGLVFQAVFLSEKVRNINADTLPDLANKTVGKSAELIIAIIIVISWIGVIAGQFVAMNNLITFALGKNSKWIFAIVATIVIAYTMIGGQMSVVKTDKIQLFLIVFGIIGCMLYLYFSKSENNEQVFKNIEFLNENYTCVNLFMQFFVIGGVYFLGPDIMSRNFICKDGKTAKKSAFIAGAVLLIFSILITFIGMWLRFNVAPEVLAGKSALMYAVSILPKPVAVLLIFGLLSAILSSTDTCLINASTIFAKDIIKKESVLAVRLTVLAIGTVSMLLAIIGRNDIMSLLTGAYSIYTPGVIFPLMIAILVWQKKDLRKGIWISAVIAGGIFGLAGSYFKPLLIKSGLSQGFFPYLPLIGMAISLILAICSVKWKKNQSL